MKAITIQLTLILIIALSGCNNYNKRPNKTIKTEVEILDSIKKANQELEFYLNGRKISNYFVSTLPQETDSVLLLPKGENCALVKFPDSAEISKLKNDLEDDTFRELIDVNEKYFEKVNLFLEEKNIKIFNSERYRYVAYAKDDSTSIYLDLKSKYSLPWILLFFSKERGVGFMDYMEVQNEYNSFYE